MKKRWVVCVTAAVAMVCCCAFGQEELHSWVANALGKVTPRLEKAEKLMDQGDPVNAKVYLEEAQKEWDRMHESLKDKFDESHPEIVAVRKHLMAVSEKVGGAAGAKEESAPVPAATDDQAAGDALPSTMVYEMKQINAALDRNLARVATMTAEEARKTLEAQNTWEIKKEWNKGKFDPNHPDVLALDAKYAQLTKALEARVGKGADAEGNLEGVLGAIRQNAEALKAAHEDAKWKVRSISSKVSDGDAEKVSTEMDKARGAVERVNSLLPGVREAVAAFRKQYPDMEEFKRLVTDWLPARNAVDQVERFPKSWLDEVGREVTAALDAVQKNLKLFGLEDLAGKQGLDETLTTNWADSAEEHVVVLSNTLLDTIDVLLPELPEADRAALPEFVQARQKALDRAAPMRTEIAKVEAEARKIRKDMVSAKQRKLAAARFPKSEFHGGKWDDAEKAIRKAFKAKITDRELVKIGIYLPWEERQEAKWRKDHWEVETYRYIGANCLAKLGSDKYMVYRMNFRNTKLPDGDWSPLEQWSVGHVYEILEENIGK